MLHSSGCSESPWGAGDLSFLAPPGQIQDWRMTVLVDAAEEMGVLAALPATKKELCEDLGLDRHALGVMLDALGAFGVVERAVDDVYRPGPDALEPEAVAVLRHHARALRRWSTTVDDCLRGADVGVNRGPMLTPERFIDALAVGARRLAPGIVNSCLARFPDARRVLDLGGGHGEYALEFARRGLQVTMQDLPAMIEVLEARGHLGEAGVELFAGDFFEVLPDGPYDLVLCAGVTHTFDAEHNQTLYRRLRPLLSEPGGLVVVTFLRGRNAISALFAVQMLVNGAGGDSHSEEDYRTWLAEAAFASIEIVQVEDRPQTMLFALPTSA